MSERVLITGGAGFIGSHLADELVRQGYRVRLLDNLHAQVHGGDGGPPDYLSPDVDLVVGDVRDPSSLKGALSGVDAVVHLAARVGVGQSMYRLHDYVSANEYGTAVLLEQLARRPVRRLVVASSMSIYGEGLYRTVDGRPVSATPRTLEQLERGEWEVRDDEGSSLVPLPTPEWKTPDLTSVYALSKFAQERMCFIGGAAYGIPTIALRLFNVYGPRQALSNPYTGVLAIFAARILNGRPPMVFEDGLQRRDFVSVHDAARAARLALESDGAVGRALNVGSGRGRSVLEVADTLARALGRDDIRPDISGRSRVGDIRHCIADISLARELLGFTPEVGFEEGVVELCEWVRGRTARDRVGMASAELHARGLTVGGTGDLGQARLRPRAPRRRRDAASPPVARKAEPDGSEP